MKRIVENQLEQSLIDAMYRFHSLLKDGFMSQSKINIKVDIPKFSYSDLDHHKELRVALECLKNNYREYLKYLRESEYIPVLKVLYFYEDCEECTPVILNLSLSEFLNSDFYVKKDDLELK